MAMARLRFALLASVISMPLPAFAQNAASAGPVAGWSEKNPWAELNIGGYYSEPRNSGVYGGFLYSLNNDIWSQGLLVRVNAGHGEYPYRVNAPVTYDAAGVLLGYRFNGDRGGHLTLFAGPDFIFTHQSDVRATPRGAEWGAKAIADMSVALAPNLGFDFYGSISSIRTLHFAQARITQTVAPGWKVGPEVASLADKNFQHFRAGGFIAMDPGKFNITFDGGYEFDEDRRGVGFYAGIGLSLRLR